MNNLQETSSAYRRHICDIYFYISSIPNLPSLNWTDINIVNDGIKLQNQIRTRLANGENFNNDEFCNTIINCGNILLCAYYYQYKDNIPSDLEKFKHEHELVTDIYNLICQATGALKGRQKIIEEPAGGGGGGGRNYPDKTEFYSKILMELKKNPEKFKLYTRMSQRQFDFLISLITPQIKNCNTYRDIVPAEMRVIMALRYLATGENLVNISTEYLIDQSILNQIICETCQAIWSVLQPLYVSWPTDLLKVADEFDMKLKFPNCCGVVGGKHIRIQKPAHSEQKYYNRKNFYSIVLMAVCDADCNFIYATIGGYGSQTGESIWSNCSLGRRMRAKEIAWPNPRNLPNSDIPYEFFLIGDLTLPLTQNFLRPYRGKNLSEDKLYFNKRLDIAKNVVGRTFDMLANRFRIFQRDIQNNVETIELVVKAAITLYNYIKMTADGDTPDVNQHLVGGNCFENLSGVRGRQTNDGTFKRDIYKNYLCLH